MDRLRITLLGGFEVSPTDGRPLTFATRKAKALLAYLAMSGGRAQARDKLAALLWENSGAEQARASLRQTLWRLRKLLNTGDAALIRVDGDSIVLDSTAGEIDAVQFERLVDLGTPDALEQASALYRGSFLEGLAALAEPYEEWLMAERMRLHELAESALVRLLSYYRSQAHATEHAIRVAGRLLALDPLQEPVHRLLMQLYIDCGRPRSALRQYELCRDFLRRELGTVPDAKTRQLAEQIGSAHPEVITPQEFDRLGPAATTTPLQERAAPAYHTERRFLTLVSCELLGTATMSNSLDLEDLRAVIVWFEDCCEAIVDRHGGHVLHCEEQCITACFGYPLADEHDAERAARAALEIIPAIEKSTTFAGLELHTRISIASGEVVIGDRTRNVAVTEKTITGDAPHVVSVLRALAEPNSLLIADSTKHLLGGLFEYQDLGTRTVAGLAQPLRIWRVLGERPVQDRFGAVRGTSELTPLVGREEELELLMRRWQRAKAGAGQVVILAGEPGIGKSRLVVALAAMLTGEPHTPVHYYCSPHHTESALYPVNRQLEHAAGIARDDSAAVKLDKLEALLARATDAPSDTVPVVAALLSIPTETRYPALDLTPQRQKTMTLEVLEAHLAGLAKRQPVLMIVENLHWIDPITREFLGRMVDRVQTLPLLLIITHRPGTPIPWAGEPQVTSLLIKRLSLAESADMVSKLTGRKPMPQDVLAQILGKADGVPLFIEELTKNVLESGALDDEGSRYTLSRPLAAFAVPDTLQDLLLARLDRLGPAKTAAQEAAVIGRHFSYELLAAVSSLSEAELQAALARLADAELVYAHGTAPDASYSFKHALVQDAAYASLVRVDRAPLHERIAKALEVRFPEKTETEPEVLAHHFTEAGFTDKAIFYWQKAGELAVRRSALREALACFQKALESLQRLPQSDERNGQELGLQVLLGQTWMLAAGYAAPEVEAAYMRARELCEQTGDSFHLFYVLLGLWQLYIAKEELAPASATAQRLLPLALSQHNNDFAIEAHVAQVVTYYTLGEFDKTLAHANKAIALNEPGTRQQRIQRFGYDGSVIALTGAAWAYWALGYPDLALPRAQEALSTAASLAHPYTQTMALYCSAWLHLFRREAGSARELAQQSMALSNRHGFAWPEAYAAPVAGWALAEEGKTAEGIDTIRTGLAVLEQMGHRLWRPHQQGLLAEACARAGQIDAALAVITEALESVDRTGDVEHAAELQRQKGELLLRQESPDAAARAEQCFRQALEIARGQKAKSWELRATTSLARLWCAQGKREQARELLAPVYDWFSEGFDTPDLQEAKALLDRLT